MKIFYIILLVNFNLQRIQAQSDTELEDVILFCNEVLETDSMNRACLEARGEAFFKLNKQDKALNDFMLLIQCDSLNSGYLYNIGLVQIELSAFASAIEVFNNALIVDTKDSRLYFARGYSKYKINYFKEAIQDYSLCIQYCGYDDKQLLVKCYNNRGLAYTNVDLYEEAIGDFSKALILIKEPYSNIYFNRGYAFYKLNKIHEALIDLKKAHDIDPNNKFALKYLSIVYYDIGEIELACQYFKIAQEKGVKIDIQLNGKCQ